MKGLRPIPGLATGSNLNLWFRKFSSQMVFTEGISAYIITGVIYVMWSFVSGQKILVMAYVFLV